MLFRSIRLRIRAFEEFVSNLAEGDVVNFRESDENALMSIKRGRIISLLNSDGGLSGLVVELSNGETQEVALSQIEKLIFAMEACRATRLPHHFQTPRSSKGRLCRRSEGSSGTGETNAQNAFSPRQLARTRY